MNRTSFLGLAILLGTFLAGCDDDAGGCSEDDDEMEGAECSMPEPDAVAAPVLRITNSGSAPIYFNYCDYRFSVEVDGQLLPGELKSWSMATCEDTVANGPACCGCKIPEDVIQPGATFELPWSGLAFEKTAVPRSCVPGASDDNVAVHEDSVDCYQGRALPAGESRVVLHMFATGSSEDSFFPTEPFDVEVTVDVQADTAAVDVEVGAAE